MDKLYSIDNAKKFDWSSISGDLNKERISFLNKYLIGTKVLDAGCGGGGYVDYLTSEGFDVIGVDKYYEFLKLAKFKKGKYVQGDIVFLPFPDKYFDCSISFDVLEHVNDDLAFQELLRVTKSRIIFAVPQEDTMLRKYGLVPYPYQDPTHLRYYTEESIKNFLTKYDIRSTKIILEGLISFPALFREVFLFDCLLLRDFLRIIRPSYRLKINIKYVNFFIEKFIDVLVFIIIDIKKYMKSMLDIIINDRCFKKINLGLLVVVDL
jgi:SAM-dependent methyltransferase